MEQARETLQLISRREQLDLTQGELADMVEVGRHTVMRWERGTHKPTRTRMPRLAQALELPQDEVAGWFR